MTTFIYGGCVFVFLSINKLQENTQDKGNQIHAFLSAKTSTGYFWISLDSAELLYHSLSLYLCRDLIIANE